MDVELIDRGIMNTRKQAYALNSNSLAGFKNAVNNGQTRLALEYAEIVIDDLLQRLVDLENATDSKTRITVETETIETTTEKTPRKKTPQEKTPTEEV